MTDVSSLGVSEASFNSRSVSTGLMVDAVSKLPGLIPLLELVVTVGLDTPSAKVIAKMMRNSFSPCLLILEEFARLLVAKRAQFMSSCWQQRDSSKWNFAKGSKQLAELRINFACEGKRGRGY